MSYKFKIGNNIPPDDKIDKHKDFKKLRANYDKQVAPLYKRPLYKDPKALLVVLAIALLTYILVEVYQEEKKEEHDMKKEQRIEAPAPQAGPSIPTVDSMPEETITVKKPVPDNKK